MYTLREFVERIMKGDPYASRVTSFEKNVQDPFEEKYPKMWLCVSLCLDFVCSVFCVS